MAKGPKQKWPQITQTDADQGQGCFHSLTSDQLMSNEYPPPEPTAADFDRVLRREFAPRDVAEASATLELYTAREAQRVRLATIRLANGDLTRLKQEVHNACCDWRDVLLPAEYPSQSSRKFRLADEKEKERIRETDWRKYHEWYLHGLSPGGTSKPPSS